MIAVSRSGSESNGLESRLDNIRTFLGNPVERLHTMALNVDGQVVSNNAADRANLPGVIAAYSKFWQQEGKHLEQRYGKPDVDVAHPGSENLGENNVAAYAVLKSGHRVLLGDRNYERKMAQFARSYGMDRELANRYVWLHEFAHSKGMDTEEGAERFVKNYAEEQMAKATNGKERADYQKLAEVAANRIRFGSRLDEMRRKSSAKQYNLSKDVQLEHRLAKFASAYGLSPDEASHYARTADRIRSTGVQSPADIAAKAAKVYKVLASQSQGELKERYSRLADAAQRHAEYHKSGNGSDSESDESRKGYVAVGTGGSGKYKAKRAEKNQVQAKAA